MYRSRLRTLKQAYEIAARENKKYDDTVRRIEETRELISREEKLLADLQQLGAIITAKENQWRRHILDQLESEIDTELAAVFPTDNYSVKLEARVLRGKIHIETTVSSAHSGRIPGSIQNTQGTLFQEIVSFSALVAVMDLLGVRTVYIDEAFAGASKENQDNINALLRRVQELGIDVVIISQSNYFEGLEANVLILSRSLDNKTSIRQVSNIGSE